MTIWDYIRHLAYTGSEPSKEMFIKIKDNGNDDEVIGFYSKYLSRESRLFILLETHL